MSNQTAQLLERHFDTAFAAPDGIKKLRELILTLAMQGKLVEQDSNDPPAGELLKEIEIEKERLVKAGKIKKVMVLPLVKLEEIPFEVSEGWTWVYLQDLFALVTDGDHQAPPKSDSGVPFLVIGNLNTGKVKTQGCRHVPREYYEALDWGRKPVVYDILYTVTGSYGIPIMVDVDFEFCVQRHVAILKTVKNTPVPYLCHLLKSTYVYDYATSIATGIAQKTVPLTKLRSMLVPLPPAAEQHRIVAKINQLMARCDELEKLRTEREQKRLAIHTAAIRQLLDAENPDNHANGWQFLTQKFGELYTVKENVAELRKAILQLAVMGKLVPQNPNDPPASALLKEIEAEKQRLVKERKMKELKLLPAITPEDVPFQLPRGWEWVRTGEIGDIKLGRQRSPKDHSGPFMIPYLRVANVFDN